MMPAPVPVEPVADIARHAEKKDKKMVLLRVKNTTLFEHTPICLEVSVSSFAERHRVFDQKVQKTYKKQLMRAR